MLELIKKFLSEDEGASMAEYAILLAVITAALVGILHTYTNSMADIFNYISNTLHTALQGSTGS